MKVLMTADTVGGVWSYALELARVLESFDVEIILASTGALPSPAQRAAAESRPNITLYASAYRLEWMPDPWSDIEQAGEWLLEIAAHTRPDIIHLNDYAHGALPWNTPVLMAGHSCVLSWWQAVHGQPAPNVWARYRETVRRGVDGADMIVAPTHAMLTALERHYGLSRRRRVISNARASNDYPPGRKQALILAAGRLWDEAKNVQALARVAPELDWPVAVAGETRTPGGGEPSAFSNVQALGRLSRAVLAKWYATASIYALPARYEPFGLSALEAALAGCALVLGDIPSLREVWDDTALFVPPGDQAALAAALQALIADKGLRARYGSRARNRASWRYAPTRMGAAYHAAYDELLGVRNSAPVRLEIARP
ncbi:MAG: glycosyltransferase family 4 protein [Gammaproteobacteria bacterium]